MHLHTTNESGQRPYRVTFQLATCPAGAKAPETWQKLCWAKTSDEAIEVAGDALIADPAIPMEAVYYAREIHEFVLAPHHLPLASETTAP